MNLKVLDNYRIKSDDNNYIVEEYGIIRYKDTERYDIKKTTYHPTLVRAFKYILKQQLKKEEYNTIDDVIRNMKSIEERILNDISLSITNNNFNYGELN